MRHDERLDEDTRLRTEDLVAAGETRHDGQNGYDDHEGVERRSDDADALPPPRNADGAEYSLSDDSLPGSEHRTRADDEFPVRADTDTDLTDTDRDSTDTDRYDTDTDRVDTDRPDTDDRVDTGSGWSRTDEDDVAPVGSGATDSVPEQVEESARPTMSPDGEDAAPMLFRPEDVDRFRTEWQQVQTMFVDDPREAVQSADHLVAEVMQALASMFNEHKQELEGNWREEGTDLQTEDLRIALRRYRSFFYQLLDA